MILINSSSKNTTGIYQRFFPINPPVGIGYLASYLRKNGIDARIVDEQVEDNIMEIVAQHIKTSTKPHLFGFSVLTAALSRAVDLSREIKEQYPDSFIVFGGIHPSAMPAEMLSFKHVDAVIRGEGEKPLLDLYRCVKNGTDYSGIDNLSFKKDGKFVHNPVNYIIEDLSTYPPFPYHLFDNNKYDLGFVFASRGCPFKCIFCSCKTFPGSSKYRTRPPKHIVEELEMLKNKYGITSVIFLDDNFLVDKKRIYELLSLIKDRQLDGKMKFAFQARGDSMDEALLGEMKKTGFEVVLFGLETASEKIMKTIDKGETVAQCVAGVKAAKKLGYTTGATFVFGLPGETHQDRIECLKLSRQLDIAAVRFNNAIPYPGTELYAIAKRTGRLSVKGLYENFIAVSALTENPFKEIPLAYVPEENTEKEIKTDVLLCQFSYYLQPSKFIRLVLGNSGKNVKWFNSGNFVKSVKNLPAMIFLIIMLTIKFNIMLINLIQQNKMREFLTLLFGNGKHEQP